MSRLLAKTPATPNQVSLVSFAIALGSLGLFLSGHNIWAGVAAQASSIVDGADGDLARLKNMSTPFGGFFDAVLDRYADVAILAGLAYWSIESEEWVSPTLVVAVGLLAIVGALLVSYTRARVEASMGISSGISFPGLAGALATRDARLLAVMIGAVAGQAFATLALLTHALVVWRVAIVRGAPAPEPSFSSVKGADAHEGDL